MKVRFGLIVLIAFLAFSCSEESQQIEEKIKYESFGLTGRVINKLKFSDNYLLAATDDGLYRKDLKDLSDWTLLGLDNYDVVTLDINGSTIVASTVDQGQEEYKLFRSFNKGNDWEELTYSFGGEFPEPVKALKFHPAQSVLLATGYNVIASSDNGGESWEAIHGHWNSMSTGLNFVEVNPLTEEIWAGGQNAIEELVVYKINYNENFLWRTLLPSPSVAKDIAFHPFNSNEVLIGAEGGIIKTSDNGESWTTIKENHEEARFYFGLNYDPNNPDIIYAAGWIKEFTNPQPLILYISNDKGATWRSYTNGNPHVFGGVYDMLLTTENDQTIIYLGLYKGGVYKVTLL